MDGFYLLGPKVQLLVDKLDELRVAKREKIDNLIDPPQELVSSEVSLQAQGVKVSGDGAGDPAGDSSDSDAAGGAPRGCPPPPTAHASVEQGPGSHPTPCHGAGNACCQSSGRQENLSVWLRGGINSLEMARGTRNESLLRRKPSSSPFCRLLLPQPLTVTPLDALRLSRFRGSHQSLPPGGQILGLCRSCQVSSALKVLQKRLKRNLRSSGRVVGTCRCGRVFLAPLQQRRS